MGGFGGFGGQSGGMGGMGGFGAMSGMDEGDEKRRKGDKLGESRTRRRGKKDADDDEKETKDKGEHHEGDAVVKAPPTVATPADFNHSDFAITPLQALRVILEVASPGTVKALRWHLESGRMSQSHETISLLEFMETELIFPEFVRLLIRISDLGTRKDFALCERLSAAARFEGFVRHIFFPALRTPYVPSPPADETTEKGSDAARSNEEAAPGSARDVAEAESGEGSNAGKEDMPDPTKEDVVSLWAGFDDYSCAEVESHHAARRWATGYENEVANWM